MCLRYGLGTSAAFSPPAALTQAHGECSPGGRGKWDGGGSPAGRRRCRHGHRRHRPPGAAGAAPGRRICPRAKHTICAAPASDMIYLDDNVTHLYEPHKAGYNVMLTGWGAVLNEHKILSKKEGIKILSISYLNKILIEN